MQPYGLIVKQGEWYLVGYCESAEELRTFKCERITKAELLEEEYAIPADFSLEAFWCGREKQFKQSRRFEENYPVTLRLKRPYPELIKQLEVLNIAADQGQHSITVNMYCFEQACGKVMALPMDIEVLEPPVLREYIKERSLLLHKMYT